MRFDYWQTLEEGGFYHIYNRSVNQERIFSKEEEYISFLQKMAKYFLPYMDIYAYCLMPNHFHFVVQVLQLDESIKAHLAKEKTKAADKLILNEITIDQFLEDQFRRMFSSIALSYNFHHKRTGTLFQKRPKRVGLSTEPRLLNAILYTHHNCIHHKLTKDYTDWKYSSYNAILSNQPTQVSRKKVLEWFGSGNPVLGRKLFLQHHAEYRHPPFEPWMLDD
ncbi:MAG: hypothetical protein GC192_14805 [Bacteroidetes bacterium]|nr:hypothetical protein [Bacteroidota bacterium]